MVKDSNARYNGSGGSFATRIKEKAMLVWGVGVRDGYPGIV